MERLPLYKEYAQKLIDSGKAFRCWCTKEELAEQREALKKKDPKAQFKYPGTCRNRTEDPAKTHVVRFKAPTEGSITYVDKVFGEVTTPNVENQDFVILRSDGVPLYNFGAVVDDVTMGITIVARGRDHMINTPPQILIYEALGAKVPEFAHLPMMLAQSGEKLSKRHGAVSVTEYRDKGYSPMAVLNYLARFGWSFGDQEVFSRDELIAAFSWENCGRGDGKFDDKKFLAINHEHLKTERLTPNAEYAERVPRSWPQMGLPGVETPRSSARSTRFAIAPRPSSKRPTCSITIFGRSRNSTRKQRRSSSSKTRPRSCAASTTRSPAATNGPKPRSRRVRIRILKKQDSRSKKWRSRRASP